MDDVSYKLLKIFQLKGSLSMRDLSLITEQTDLELAGPLNYLRGEKYLQIESNYAALHVLDETSTLDPNMRLSLSFLGTVAIEKEAKERRQSKFENLRAWATLATAIAALVISALALVLK